ncbi:MAG: lysoplasmalogenase [Chloroflexota bacterium]
MLDLPISTVEITIFGIALIVWAGLLFGGFVIGTPNEDDTRRMPVQTRLLSSFVLVIASWMWFAISQGTPVSLLAAWFAIGMTLGFIGDVFMAQILSVEPHVLYGMSAFGIGHIAYIIGMWLIALPHERPYPNITLLLMCWGIVAIVWLGFILRPRTTRTQQNTDAPSLFLVFAALPYSLLLATTVGFAISLALLDPTFVLISIGAVLFLVSDLLIALRLFNGLRFRLVDDVVWFLYGPGQMLIIFGLIIATVVDALVG